MSDTPACGMTLHNPDSGLPMVSFAGTSVVVVMDLLTAYMRDAAMTAALDALVDEEPKP